MKLIESTLSFVSVLRMTEVLTDAFRWWSGRKKLIMSILSEVKNLNAKCADTAFFFIWGAKKNVNAEKRKED